MMASPVIRRVQLVSALPVLLLIAVSIAFRGAQLDRIPAINGDETFTTVQMTEMVQGKPITLWVPTQRLLSPIYAAWVLTSQTVYGLFAPHSFWTVRVPALAAGILLLLLSFILSRKAWGSSAAMLTTLVLATSPMAIAYSRSAVEQCLMGVVGLIAIFFAWEAMVFSTILAFGAAILSHPVNVFLGPILFCTLWARSRSTLSRRQRIGVPLVFATIIAILLWSLPPEYGLLNLQSVARFFLEAPWQAVEAFATFLLYFVRILSGVTVYEYFAMPPSLGAALLLDSCVAVGLTLLLFFGVRALRRGGEFDKLWFLAGLGLSLLAFFIVAGPKALAPGLSRQANFLPVPVAIAVALLMTALPSFRLHEGRYWRAAIVGAAILLASFWVHYFRAIYRTGGGFTHRTYATGPVEPKAATFRWILKDSAGRPTVILAEDWWIYWPMRYLANEHPELRVINLDQSISEEAFRKLFEAGGYALGFPGGKIENLIRRRYRNTSITTFQPESYSRSQVLTAWRFGETDLPR